MIDRPTFLKSKFQITYGDKDVCILNKNNITVILKLDDWETIETILIYSNIEFRNINKKDFHKLLKNTNNGKVL